MQNLHIWKNVPFREVNPMNKKQILLGGDSGTLSMPMDFFSNTHKFRVRAVHNGDEALQCLAERKYDLAILDLNLAEKGGDECCQEAKQAGLSPSTPIVLMVRMQNRPDIARCLNSQCDALLVKPLEYEQLSGVTTRLLFKNDHSASRFDVHLSIHFGIHPQKQIHGYSADLSTSGIFIEAHNIVPVDTLLNVEFTLPNDGATIKCLARVAWLNGPVARRDPLLPPGMGLEFLKIDSQGVNAIRNFLFSEERFVQTRNHLKT
jgi:CheY-like chemotaxis protein